MGSGLFPGKMGATVFSLFCNNYFLYKQKYSKSSKYFVCFLYYFSPQYEKKGRINGGTRFMQNYNSQVPNNPKQVVMF